MGRTEKSLRSYQGLLRRFQARHDKDLRSLRGQVEWTPELIEVVQKVIGDRALMGFLNTVAGYGNSSGLRDWLEDTGEALFDYTEKYRDGKLGKKVEGLIDDLHEEAEALPGGFLDPKATALRRLESIDYRAIIEKAQRLNDALGRRDELLISDHLRWLSDLRGNPALLEEWEDHLPSEVDTRDLAEDFEETPLYSELKKREMAVNAFKRDATNLLDVLDDTKKLGR
jgi:hypothetical protein